MKIIREEYINLSDDLTICYKDNYVTISKSNNNYMFGTTRDVVQLSIEEFQSIIDYFQAMKLTKGILQDGIDLGQFAKKEVSNVYIRPNYWKENL